MVYCFDFELNRKLLNQGLSTFLTPRLPHCIQWYLKLKCVLKIFFYLLPRKTFVYYKNKKFDVFQCSFCALWAPAPLLQKLHLKQNYIKQINQSYTWKCKCCTFCFKPKFALVCLGLSLYSYFKILIYLHWCTVNICPCPTLRRALFSLFLRFILTASLNWW